MKPSTENQANNQTEKSPEITPILAFFKEYVDKPLPPHAPPFTLWLGGMLKKAEFGNIEFEFLVRKEMTNPLGMLHGGMSAAILDDIMGMTVASLPKENHAVSVNLNINFLGKAYENEMIYARSKLVRQGGQIIAMEGEILDKDGKIVATATSSLLVISKK